MPSVDIDMGAGGEQRQRAVVRHQLDLLDRGRHRDQPFDLKVQHARLSRPQSLAASSRTEPYRLIQGRRPCNGIPAAGRRRSGARAAALFILVVGWCRFSAAAYGFRCFVASSDAGASAGLFAGWPEPSDGFDRHAVAWPAVSPAARACSQDALPARNGGNNAQAALRSTRHSQSHKGLLSSSGCRDGRAPCARRRPARSPAPRTAPRPASCR